LKRSKSIEITPNSRIFRSCSIYWKYYRDVKLKIDISVQSTQNSLKNNVANTIVWRKRKQLRQQEERR